MCSVKQTSSLVTPVKQTQALGVRKERLDVSVLSEHAAEREHAAASCSVRRQGQAREAAGRPDAQAHFLAGS